MTTRSGIRFTAKTQNGQRALLGASIQPKGDLILAMYPALTYVPSGKQPSPNDPEIIEQRYSIHPSKQSKEGVNVIKQTLTLSAGPPIITHNFTKAIKNKDRYVHIFSRRCGALLSTRFDLTKNRGQYVELMQFDTSKGTLCVSVFAGSSELIFRRKDPQCSIFQKILGEFRLTIMWSFMPFPSHHTGSRLHSMTFDPNLPSHSHIKANLEAIMLGYDERECLDCHKICCSKFRDEMIKIYSELPGVKDTDLNFLLSLGYSKSSDFLWWQKPKKGG
jgi:hypothetical protein